MMPIDPDRLKELIYEKNLTINAVAEMTGYTKNTFFNNFRSKKMNERLIMAIAQQLGVDSEQFADLKIE